jgi:hypothetical protein
VSAAFRACGHANARCTPHTRPLDPWYAACVVRPWAGTSLGEKEPKRVVRLPDRAPAPPHATRRDARLEAWVRLRMCSLCAPAAVQVLREEPAHLLSITFAKF